MFIVEAARSAAAEALGIKSGQVPYRIEADGSVTLGVVQGSPAWPAIIREAARRARHLGTDVEFTEYARAA